MRVLQTWYVVDKLTRYPNAFCKLTGKDYRSRTTQNVTMIVLHQECMSNTAPCAGGNYDTARTVRLGGRERIRGLQH